MAVQSDALEVILRVLGARSFQTSMGEARASVAGLSKEAKAADATMMSLGKRAEMVGRVSGTVAKVGLIALGVAAAEGINQSIKFQKEMTLVQTQAGATAGELVILNKQVLELAKIRPQGPVELAKGLYHFQSVFQNAKTAIDALTIASEGAAVGNANLEDTSTALGSALRAIFRDVQPSLQQMKATMGTLNAIIGAGNMRMDELTMALGTNVVPAAITAGLSINDVGGALALLTDEGQRADNAATHLRMAFTLMGATSKIAQKNLREIGISATELGAIMQSGRPDRFVEALALVRTQLSKKFPTFAADLSGVRTPQDALALAKRFQTISKAFGGARSSATVMQLLNNLDLLKQKTDLVASHGNRMDAAFKVWQHTADAQLHTALSGLQADLIDFGDKIRDPAIKYVKMLIGVGDTLVKKIDVWGPAVIALGTAWVGVKLAILAARGALISFEAISALSMILSMVGTVTGLADAFVLLGWSIEATPVGWIITAIALLIIVVALVVTHFKWFKQAAADVWNWAKEHWAFVMLLNPFLGIIALIGAKWKALKPIFAAVLDFLSPALKAVADTAKSIFTHILGYVKGMVQGIIAVVNFMIRAYNKLPSFLRPTGKISPIGGWGMNEGPNKNAKLIPGSRPMSFIPATSTGSEFGSPSRLGLMPGGGITSAHSLRKPRAHTPGPEPLPDTPVFENHTNVFLDGKQIFKSVSKRTADKKARK